MNRITKLLVFCLPVAVLALAPSLALADITIAGDYGPADTTLWLIDGPGTGAWIGTTGLDTWNNAWGSVDVTSSSTLTTKSTYIGCLCGTQGSVTVSGGSYWATTFVDLGGDGAGPETYWGTGVVRVVNSTIEASSIRYHTNRTGTYSNPTYTKAGTGIVYLDGAIWNKRYDSNYRVPALAADYAYLGAGGLDFRGYWARDSSMNSSESLCALLEDPNSPGGGLTVYAARSETSFGQIKMTGANTYTGDTSVTGGTLTLDYGASMVLDIHDLTNTEINVASGAFMNLQGSFKLNLDDVTTDRGTWTLVDTSAGGGVAYGTAFGLETTTGGLFDTEDFNVYTYIDGTNVWSFNTSTSQLTCVPEPATLGLLLCGLVGLMAYAWRKRK